MSLQNLNNPSGGGSGGSGLSSVTADAPLSGSGTSGSHLVIANASGAAVGVVQLTGDFGGTATAPTVVGLSHVTNASLPASGIAAINPSSLTGSGRVPFAGLPLGGNEVSTVIEPFPHYTATANNTLSTSGQIVYIHFTAKATLTVSNISVISGTAQAATITLVRLGLNTISGNTYTPVMETASDTTILASANTLYTRAASTSRSLAGSFQLVEGTRYAGSIIMVGTGSPSITPKGWGGITAIMTGLLTFPDCVRVLNSQSDLPTAGVTVTVGGGSYAWMGFS